MICLRDQTADCTLKATSHISCSYIRHTSKTAVWKVWPFHWLQWDILWGTYPYFWCQILFMVFAVLSMYEWLHFYRPQTKFGARQCFYTCLSFCSGGGFPACITGHMTMEGGLHPGWGDCIQQGWGICIQGEGGLPTGTLGSPPTRTRKWVVCILLEWFLFIQAFFSSYFMWFLFLFSFCFV